MAQTIRRVAYFYATIEDQPGEAYELLTQLASLGVNLLALTAVPLGPERTQLALFPEDAGKMAEAARHAGLSLDGRRRRAFFLGLPPGRDPVLCWRIFVPGHVSRP